MTVGFTNSAETVFDPTQRPSLANAQLWGIEAERLMQASLTNAAVFDTKADLDASLTWAANTMAWVVADATLVNRGVYRKNGASGSGSWTRIGDLPYNDVNVQSAIDAAADAVDAATDAEAAKVAAEAAAAALASITITRGTTARSLVSILRDTPPSAHDFGAVGNGTTNDTTAVQNCLNTYGICYLPQYQSGTYTDATYLLGGVVLADDQRIVGPDDKVTVKQASGGNAIIIRGYNTGVRNLCFDQGNQTASGIAQATILLDTDNAVSGVWGCRLERLQLGIGARNGPAYPGYDGVRDSNSAKAPPAIAIGIYMDDVWVHQSQGHAFRFDDLFAYGFMRRCKATWQSAAFAPALPGVWVRNAAGFYIEDTAVEAGTIGTSGHHAYDIQSSAAIVIKNSRADTVGDNGFNLVSINSVEMSVPVAALCGGHQIYIEGVQNLQLVAPVIQGRSGIGTPPANKHGLFAKSVTATEVISRVSSTLNTGDAIRIESCTRLGLSAPTAKSSNRGIAFVDSSQCQVVGGYAVSNATYGVEDTGTSNFNGVTGMHFSANTTSNGRFAGASSFVSAIMRASGVPLQWSIPGSGVNW